jgi:hypothetical protein
MIYRLALLLTALALLCSGCVAIHASTNNIAPVYGEVYAVQIGQTMWGMKQVIAEKAGTLIMQKDNMLTFIWSVKDGWCFAVLNSNSKTAVENFAQIAKGGNMVSPRTMSDLVTWMQKNGWSAVSSKEIPTYIVAAIESSAVWLANLASNMTTFLILPGYIQPPEGARRIQL